MKSRSLHASAESRPYRCPRVLVWLSALLLAGFGAPVGAHAQGLMDIGAPFIEDVDLPFSGEYSSSLGLDSDAGNRDEGFSGRGRTTTDSGASMVWQNSLSLVYGAKLKGRHSLSFNGNYSNLFYFDPPPGTDEMDHNLGVGLRYSRQLSRKLTLSDALYVSYETEPNYDIGLSVTRPTSGYFLATNSLTASYQWNQRFSTVSGYNFSTILYEDSSLEQEGYMSHGFAQDFRYAFKRKLTGVLTYRFESTNYQDNEEGDSFTHSLLGGIDWVAKRRLSMTGRVGADYRIYDGEMDNQWAPRVELGFNYLLAKRTNARWVNAFGLDDTGRAGAQTGYSYRSSLSVGHEFTRRLASNGSINYIHSDYGDSLEGFVDGSEDTFAVSMGVNYQLWRSVSLFANYSFSFISEQGVDDYTRHRLFLGMSYAF